jgi:hypothetical protein
MMMTAIERAAELMIRLLKGVVYMSWRLDVLDRPTGLFEHEHGRALRFTELFCRAAGSSNTGSWETTIAREDTVS